MYEEPNNRRWGRVGEWIVVLPTIASTVPACVFADSLLLRVLMAPMAVAALGWGLYLLVTGPES